MSAPPDQGPWWIVASNTKVDPKFGTYRWTYLWNAQDGWTESHGTRYDSRGHAELESFLAAVVGMKDNLSETVEIMSLSELRAHFHYEPNKVLESPAPWSAE